MLDLLVQRLQDYGGTLLWRTDNERVARARSSPTPMATCCNWADEPERGS